MSWLSQAVHGIGHAATQVGHAVGDAASNPWVQGLTAAALAATGVGAPAAAAIMAAEKGGGALLKPGGNIGQGLEQGALGAGEGALASGVGSAVRGAMNGGGVTGALKAIPGVSKLASDITGGGSNTGTPGTSPSGLPSWLSNALGDVGGLGGLAKLGLGAATGLSAADLSKQASQYGQDALNQANQSYTDRAPLRSIGLAAMENPTANINLSGLSQIASRNPFAAKSPPPPQLAAA